jgi:hypothetical protein
MSASIDSSRDANLSELIEYFDMNIILKNYEVKHFHEYSLFLKWELNDIEVQYVTPLI